MYPPEPNYTGQFIGKCGFCCKSVFHVRGAAIRDENQYCGAVCYRASAFLYSRTNMIRSLVANVILGAACIALACYIFAK